MYLVGNNWANCLKTHNKLTMCLPGKTPSAPSGIGVQSALENVLFIVGLGQNFPTYSILFYCVNSSTIPRNHSGH